ncbi:UDP-N-acetylmuramoyl-L-alanyl-D-glutamate--2,6-diaminopimelate ligase [Tumebacillus permanentifrigoris]|uniref:UDP-N-acetylmuramoyl-L-alanyl-D-glutamate--2,6-diaminopimelate ligase n=1 Tax=Tumebacillus permanentifrigoris TaxID=378543 RepID=A0A316D7T2_9BACL|nr:UDP-N-acetylmuramoyl-L-alanyl-D-glutamate--2,6-diaminopimelate ligase [Tumebacillus permanentifrigoris]PWK11628.1 UDP-N-acetylmuramoylalanyl-D-glutamate--2,6-diaminopimelate ligase [Tumebacillus permanentifrigoris]
MRLRELIAPIVLKRVVGNDEVEIVNITADSRQAAPGTLFVALRGYTVDGHEYVQKAVAAGASAVVVEEEFEGLAAPQVIVRDTRAMAAVLASVFYRHASQSMKVIGVTGTNGKTTTTSLIERILRENGQETGLIGTLKVKYADVEYETANTTPEALELQRIFRQMAEAGVQYPVMEVSSHALELGRVAGTQFRTAVFTNLTQDHLDYHGSMEEYRNAKAKFFSRLGNTYGDTPEQSQFAVINADDPAAAFFHGATTAQVITYGIDQEADVRATHVQVASDGVSYQLETFAGSTELKLRMTGKFNVYNTLAAIAVCLLEGLSLEQIKRTLEAVSGVDGRFERVDAGQKFAVIVDYSHTPDSLENALRTVREFAKGRVMCLVGCGGDRDRTKRPIMAKIASEYADLAVLTSDNPRTEDPEAIIDDMEVGVADVEQNRYVRITDRAEAIRFAIKQAQADDVILIAGKGHETYQIIGKTKTHFDDREVAAAAIRGEQA